MTGIGTNQSLKAAFGLLILLCAFVQAQDPWATSGNDIYNTNSGNVGIGINNPGHELHLQKN